MASLDDLAAAIAAEPSVERSVEILVGEIARRIKATSNDQNIQRLARDLETQTPTFVEAIAGKASTHFAAG